MSESKGQAAVIQLMGWFGQYMSMTPDQLLVVAVWTCMSWVSEHVTTAPYLAITANQPGCGKTTLLELLGMVCRNGKSTTGATAAALFSMITAYDKKLTLLLDESEKRGDKIMSQLLNAGYRVGQTIPRMYGGKLVENEVYCPKAFALIGDITEDATRERTINIDLRLGKPAKRLRPAEAQLEAAVLQQMIRDALAHGKPIDLDAAPARLSGRDLELWETMFGVAVALKLDAAMMGRLEGECLRLIGLKSAAPRKADAMVTQREDVQARKFGEWVLRDLAACFREGETAITSVDAVARLRAMRGPWATLDGDGLTPDSLASLVKRFLPDFPKAVQFGKGKDRKIAKGYKLAAVRDALKGLEG